MNDLSDLLMEINLRLQALEWVEVDRSTGPVRYLLKEPRLLRWAIACTERAGFPQDALESILSSVEPDRQWWAIRQLLPEAALLLLLEKLEGQMGERFEDYPKKQSVALARKEVCHADGP